MTIYLALKAIHILSSVALVGAAFGTVFGLLFASRMSIHAGRGASLEALVVATRLAVRADAWFATPAMIVQPVSGFALVHLAGWPVSAPWMLASLALFGLAGACGLLAFVLELRMERGAARALAAGRDVDESFGRDARARQRLGWSAVFALVGVDVLMVAKPMLWG